MQSFTKHPHWDYVKKICAKLHENGFVAWLAGGCVRDGLLGLLPHDFDVATNASIEEIEKLFEKTIGVGKSFGVLRVAIPGADVEVATFRKDGPYTDGRHPDKVEEATPEEDAKRRDFTINGLFYDLTSSSVKDFVEGRKDIRARLIRTVGKAEDRFTEDKLRILRAVRFVSQLDFNLEEKTQKAITKMAKQVSEVSQERVRDEFEKLLRGKRPDRGLKLLNDTGLLQVVMPEMKYESALPVNMKKALGSHRQELLEWLFIVVSIAPEKREAFYERFKISNEKKRIFTTAIQNIEKFKMFKELSLAEKKELSASRSVALALEYLDIVSPVTALVKKFVHSHSTLPPPWIKSSHLVKLGVKPGKEMGELLRKAYHSQLSETIKSEEDALTWLKEAVKKVSPSP